jgi:hypothetical protein
MFGDGPERAVEGAFTRPIPKSPGAQMRYLVKQLKGTRPVAQVLRISRRTVERFVKEQTKKPRPDLAGRLESDVRKRWQPQVRARARRRAATTDGIVIDTRARLGYTAPIGTTDDARMRHLTLALAPQYAARLFDARCGRAGSNVIAISTTTSRGTLLPLKKDYPGPRMTVKATSAGRTAA